jgi:hypothetical protein
MEPEIPGRVILVHEIPWQQIPAPDFPENQVRPERPQTQIPALGIPENQV